MEIRIKVKNQIKVKDKRWKVHEVNKRVQNLQRKMGGSQNKIKK